VTLEEFAAWARAFAERHPAGDEERTLVQLALGLARESGETMELIQKRLRDGGWDRKRAADELGDVAYFWVRLCLAAGLEPAKALDAAVKKAERKAKLH
jgi:NTP pyrophosphatase (non-canonical NTP hydrolase)